MKIGNITEADILFLTTAAHFCANFKVPVLAVDLAAGKRHQ